MEKNIYMFEMRKHESLTVYVRIMFMKSDRGEWQLLAATGMLCHICQDTHTHTHLYSNYDPLGETQPISSSAVLKEQSDLSDRLRVCFLNMSLYYFTISETHYLRARVSGKRNYQIPNHIYDYSPEEGVVTLRSTTRSRSLRVVSGTVVVNHRDINYKKVEDLDGVRWLWMSLFDWRYSCVRFWLLGQ